MFRFLKFGFVTRAYDQSDVSMVIIGHGFFSHPVLHSFCTTATLLKKKNSPSRVILITVLGCEKCKICTFALQDILIKGR